MGEGQCFLLEEIVFWSAIYPRGALLRSSVFLFEFPFLFTLSTPFVSKSVLVPLHKVNNVILMYFFLPQAAMKLLENSSFEALSSRLCVETGESRILGR